MGSPYLPLGPDTVGRDAAFVAALLFFVLLELPFELFGDFVDQRNDVRTVSAGHECVLSVGANDDFGRNLRGLVIQNNLDFVNPVVKLGKFGGSFLDVLTHLIRDLDMTACHQNLHGRASYPATRAGNLTNQEVVPDSVPRLKEI